MPALINRVYTRPGEAQDSSNLEIASERLLETDWTFSIYGDDFSHSYEQVS